MGGARYLVGMCGAAHAVLVCAMARSSGPVTAIAAVLLVPLLMVLGIPVILMNNSGHNECDPSGMQSGVPGSTAIVFPLPEGTWRKTDDRRFRSADPVTGLPEWHAGTDYGAPEGTPIMAVASGKVMLAQRVDVGGNFVVIEHQINGEMVQTAYAHIRDGGILVEVGQTVAAGEKIAEVGSTGRSTGNHLHLEIRPNGGTGENTLDAVDWLAENNAQQLAEPGAASNGSGECVPGGTSSASGSELVRIAEEQLGKPYVWGATGPNSFDCSGLVQWSLAQMGVSIARVADDQAKAGKEVWTGTCSQIPEDLLAPGDLVAFAENHVHHQHIGIWVSPGKIIHAPMPGMFVEHAPLPGYWSAQKCSVRRVVEEDVPGGSNSGTTSKEYSLADLQHQGVIQWEGKKFTYYSQSVLPGGGLSIPGRHINAGGYVADNAGHIVLAAPSGVAHGSVFATPFGYPGKVYDTCASCTSSPMWLDVYTK